MCETHFDTQIASQLAVIDAFLSVEWKNNILRFISLSRNKRTLLLG